MNDLGILVEPLLRWYGSERRILPWREDPAPYHVWISEIMLQQTRVDTVIDYYHRFLSRFPDISSLAAADGDEVRSCWQGLGYYRRCEMLHKAAKIVEKDFGGILPRDYEKLLSLPGFGRYTAAAVMSIGFQKPYPAVDGNVLRVMMRVRNSDECIDDEKTKRRTEEELGAIMPEDHPSEFTQALMDLGATVCLPNGEPKCGLCPWLPFCEGRQRAAELPVRKVKKARRKEKRTVLLLCCNGEIALKKRPSKGLLANMWEFPNESGHLSEEEIRSRYGGEIRRLGSSVHIFSHLEWHMEGFRAELNEKTEDGGLHWIKKEEIASYAIPSAFGFIKKEL